MKSSNSRTHHRMCLTFCRWIVLGISLKHIPAISKVIYVFEKSAKQNVYACRNQVFFFFKLRQEWQKMLKIAATRFQRLPSPIYLQKMRYIRWCLLDLKLVKGPGFFVKINVSVKKCDFEFVFVFVFLISYRIYKNWTIVICFFYKRNAYKHVQPGISGRKKHMLSIFASLKTSSRLFSCLIS